MNIYWVCIIVSGIIMLSIIPTLHQLLVTISLYRRIPISEGINTLLYTIKTRNAWMVLLPVASALLFGLIFPIYRISYPSIVLLPIILLHANTLTLFFTPPSILLLGTSRRETIRLFNHIERSIYPYRVIVLLNPSQSEPDRHSYLHWLHFEFSNLRILIDSNWQIIVNRICNSVPIVVLDTRLASPAVIEETEIIFQSFLSKTIFVVDENGEAPSIYKAGRQSMIDQCRISNMDNIIKTLKEFGLNQSTSPDDNPILSQLSFNYNSKRLEREMQSIAYEGIYFSEALNNVESLYGPNLFVISAIELQKTLNGKQGDGAIEVIRDIDADILAIKEFIKKWENIEDIHIKSVINHAKIILHKLSSLQKAIDYAPQNFLKKNEEIINTIRGN